MRALTALQTYLHAITCWLVTQFKRHSAGRQLSSRDLAGLNDLHGAETLHVAEIPYEDGQIQFRYSRYMSADGTKWIRHGLFRSYYPNGAVASEGDYEHRNEVGIWHDYHEDGRLAAEGRYRNGEKIGRWMFWNSDGSSESESYGE